MLQVRKNCATHFYDFSLANRLITFLAYNIKLYLSSLASD